QSQFTEMQLIGIWNEYLKILVDDGKKIIASIMNADIPKIIESDISITLPNKLMQSKLTSHKPKLLKFVREKLDNYSIDLIIEVNEIANKKFAYTPQERYEKLKKKNPIIEELRRKFDLDI
ncbi:MAG: DNA polymerase-3 subunit gamma/tau, partial [Roseivirga sp.]